MAEQAPTNGTIESKAPVLTATYNSPTNAPFTHTQPLPSLSPSNPSLAEKTTYLSALRQATAEMQENINKELTARMEEDKTREGGSTNGTAGAKIDEAKEEDNYGEEVVEED